jgi:type I restriction enzyme S subunit
MVEAMEIQKGFKKTDVGFIPCDWNVKSIGSISQTFSGGTPNTSNRSYYGGEIPFIGSGDLNKGRIKGVDSRITKQGLENSSAKIVNSNTLLIALYGATAGVSAITEIDAAINQAVLAIIPYEDEKDFLFYFLQLSKDKIVKTYTQGGQPNLSGEIIKSIQIPLPPPKPNKPPLLLP